MDGNGFKEENLKLNVLKASKHTQSESRLSKNLLALSFSLKENLNSGNTPEPFIQANG